ncbi:MAG: hypothetical protein AMXMBFR49_21200 [Chlorobiota bacterium]
MSNQIYQEIRPTIQTLINYIDQGDLALPELQRPFVWANNRVRDLFDSMYRGYPIGYFLIWRNYSTSKINHIGNDQKLHSYPTMLLIDGQQRLTALYSVIKNKEIRDKNYIHRRIKIAFNPVTEEFKVSDASTIKNKEFISDISVLFQSDDYEFTEDYINQYQLYIEDLNNKLAQIVEKAKNKEDLTEAEYLFCISKLNQIKNPSETILRLTNELKERKIPFLDNSLKETFIETFSQKIVVNKSLINSRIKRLRLLTEYTCQALEIFQEISEEVVAEVFTRINSKGVTLNQSDFILTLVSVFWEEGRKQIDSFCRDARIIPYSSVKASSYNYILQPDSQDIVRAIVGLGFKRAKMKDAYAILKGRDPDTNKYSDFLRDKQFEKFKITLPLVLDNTSWHSFLSIVQSIGYKSSNLIASGGSVINSYIFYLIGKLEYKLDHKELERLISRWFFMSSITSRYSGSSESIMESDLNKIKTARNSAEFRNALKNIIESTLTNDFWNISLPNDLLVTSNTISPVASAYFASLIYNGTKALFSSKKVADLYDPSIKTKKASLDKHHIFPKDFLKEHGYELTVINQVTNLTYLEFIDNIKISNQEPSSYYNQIKQTYYAYREEELEKSLAEHAIPLNFYNLDYKEFLEQRRIGMAKLIQRYYDQIGN